MSQILRIVLAAALALCLTLTASFAQSETTSGTPDYAVWSTFAERVEGAVEAGRASDPILEVLRMELSGWREQFVRAQSENGRTIAATQAQIDALGPKPGENDLPEPEGIAAQRQSLEAKLAELQAPGKRAEVAQSRADVLISEIDSILVSRQTDQLLERGPTPLNPVHWPEALKALSGSLGGVRSEVATGMKSPTQREAFQQNLPGFLLVSSVSVLMLVFGWRILRALMNRFLKERRTAQGWMIGFVVSVLQLGITVLSFLALIAAFDLTEMIGLRLGPLMDALSQAGIAVIVGIWLGSFVFAPPERRLRGLALNERQSARGQHVVWGLGVVLGLHIILDEFARYDNWTASAKAVIYFPLIVIAVYFLWRLGRLFKIHHRSVSQELEENEQARYIDRMYGLLGQLIIVVAFVCPVLMALGYFNASAALTFQTIKTLLLFGLIVLAQRFLTEFWVLVSGGGDMSRDGLLPTLAGFLLMLLAVPEVLRIWGMSEARLESFWTQAREGFTIGGTKITAGAFLTFAIVFVLGYSLTRLLQGALKNSVLPKTRMDKGAQNALVSGLGYVGIFLAALLAITSAGIDLSSLAIVAGALSVGIGFGLQNIVSNFVSGIILLIERPISEGDWIEVGGTHGTVRNISVRSTRIETFDRSNVILPNADLISGKVTNYTKGTTVGRVIVPVGVAYGNDTRKIEKILMEVAESHPMVLMRPAPSVVFQGFGASSLDFEIRAILRDVNFVLSVRSDMNHEIAKRFEEEGIEIPFVQRDIWIRNPEALTGGTSSEGAPVKVSDGKVQRDDSDFGARADTEGDIGDGR